MNIILWLTSKSYRKARRARYLLPIVRRVSYRRGDRAMLRQLGIIKEVIENAMR